MWRRGGTESHYLIDTFLVYPWKEITQIDLHRGLFFSFTSKVVYLTLVDFHLLSPIVKIEVYKTNTEWSRSHFNGKEETITFPTVQSYVCV